MSIMDKLKEYKKKIRKFQDGHDESFDHLDQMNDTVLIECTHILVFNQKDDNRLVMRVFLCKREINNGNLQVLNCLDSLSFDPSLSNKSQYMCCNIYESSKLLRDCIGGSLFPYKPSELGGSSSVCHRTTSRIHIGGKVNVVIE